MLFCLISGAIVTTPPAFLAIIVPDMNCGNILGKCLTVTCGARMSGVIIGAKVPVVLTSRGSSTEEKFYSIALAFFDFIRIGRLSGRRNITAACAASDIETRPMKVNITTNPNPIAEGLGFCFAWPSLHKGIESRGCLAECRTDT